MPKLFLAAIAACFTLSSPAFALSCVEELREKICTGNRGYCTGDAPEAFEDLVVEIAEESSPLAQKLFCDIFEIRIGKRLKYKAIGIYHNYGQAKVMTIRSDYFSLFISEDPAKFGKRAIGDGTLLYLDREGRTRQLTEPLTEKVFLRNLLLHELGHHFEIALLNSNAYKCITPISVSPTEPVAKLIAQMQRPEKRAEWADKDYRAYYTFLLQTDKPTLYGSTNLREDFAELFEYYHLVFFYGENEILKYEDGSLAVDFAARFQSPIMQNKVRLMEVLMDYPDFDSAEAAQWQEDFEKCSGVFRLENLSPNPTTPSR